MIKATKGSPDNTVNKQKNSAKLKGTQGQVIKYQKSQGQPVQLRQDVASSALGVLDSTQSEGR
jgi:hypothetical protein